MGTITLESISSEDSESEDESQNNRIANDHKLESESSSNEGDNQPEVFDVSEDEIPNLSDANEDSDKEPDVPMIKQEAVDIPTENETIEEPFKPQMSNKEILAQMKREAKQGTRLVINMRPSETKLARQCLRNEMERDGRLSIQDFLKRRVNPKIFLVTSPKPQNRLIGQKVPPLKLSLKRKYGCSQCSEEFDSFDKSSEHFDKCHPGLSLEEGNAFPPLKRRSLEERNAFSVARAPNRKADQLDQCLETQPQPGPSGLSNGSDGSSFKEPKSGSIGKAKVKGKKTGKVKKAKIDKRSNEADLNIEKKVCNN